MIITISNTLRVENPTQDLKMWCKKNLVIPNPEYAKKSRMGFWMGDTPKAISLYEIEGDDLILPYGALSLLPAEIKDSAITMEGFKTQGNVDFKGDEITLLDYQETAVSEVLAHNYGILQSPAGSGKTQMGIELIKRFGKRALWLTHTHDLLSQSKERAELYIDKNLIGTISEGKVNIGKGVTFATIQTMCKLNLTQYKDYWDVIIVDECHRVAGTPTAVTQFSKVLNSLSAKHKIGLSATVHRADGMILSTYALLGSVAYAVPDEAVSERTMQVGVKAIDTGVEVSRECLNTDGTLNYTKLIGYLCDNQERTDVIVNEIVSNKEHSCLILSDRLEHLNTMMCMLPPDMKKHAVMVTGKMTSKTGKREREKAIKDMRAGTKKYLFASYKLAKEGLDIPRLDRLFLTTPQKDYAVVTQSVGRIARTFEGKENPVCYDFVDQIGFLVKYYRKRCGIYKKAHCYFVE